jgi:hypothetical protein
LRSRINSRSLNNLSMIVSIFIFNTDNVHLTSYTSSWFDSHTFYTPHALVIIHYLRWILTHLALTLIIFSLNFE